MNQLTTTGSSGRGIGSPRTIDEAMRLSEMLADSSMVPRDYQGKPGNVFIALQMGAEVGLPPMAALQNIAVIGGRPGLWGDGALAVVRTHPQFVSISEGVAGEGDDRHGWCVLTRTGQEPVRREFSVADAKRAKLWTKAGPWTEYPDRMLMMRARGFSMRDLFTDALRGIGLIEEIRDTPPEPREVPNLAQHEAAGPVSAAPGSLAETAAQVTGREIERPADPPAEPGLPLVYLDRRLVEIRRGTKSGAAAIVLWQRAAETQIARAPTAEDLRTWRGDNEPHFEALGPQYAREVRQVRNLLGKRLDALRDAEAEALQARQAAAPAETAEAAGPAATATAEAPSDAPAG